LLKTLHPIKRKEIEKQMKDKLYCEMNYKERLQEYHKNKWYGKLLSKILKAIPSYSEEKLKTLGGKTNGYKM
jgi:hypothetical protein